MIVVDASAIVKLLLAGEGAALVARRILDGQPALHVPHLTSLEVANSLRKLERVAGPGGQRVDDALSDYGGLRLERHAHEPLLPRIWELRHHLTPYDAAYVALAEALDAPLVTCDARLVRAPGHRARVELV